MRRFFPFFPVSLISSVPCYTISLLIVTVFTALLMFHVKPSVSSLSLYKDRSTGLCCKIMSFHEYQGNTGLVLDLTEICKLVISLFPGHFLF